MVYDLVLISKDKSIEDFAKVLGFSKIIFEEDFIKLGIIESKDYEVDRRIIETNKVKVLVNPHINSFKDSMYFRSGGIDQILARAASKNNIAFGFSLDSLNNPVMIGRFKQNIKLCRKYKVKMLFFTFAKNKYELRSYQDLLSLLRTFGMNGKEAKEAFTFV